MTLALLHVLLVDLEDALHVWIVFELLKCAKCLDLTLLEDKDPITQVQKVDSVSHKDSSFILKHALEDFLEDSLSHIGIQRGNGVVHHDNVRVGINGPRQTYSSLLASGEIDALLANFSHVTSWQDLEISLELARFDSFGVPLGIELLVKDNIVLDRLVLNPRCLLDIGERTSDFDRFVMDLKVSSKQV